MEGTPLPRESPDNGSRFAMQSGYLRDVVPPDGGVAFGSALGIDLQYDGRNYGHYDASRYQGIRFDAKGSPPRALAVRVSTASTTRRDNGGSCPEYGAAASTNIQVSEGWSEYRVSFDQLRGAACQGADRPFEPDQLTNIQFQVGTGIAGELELFWIDNLTFF